MKEAAYFIKRHWDGIINYTSTQITNGVMEGINSIIQAVKRRARGYGTTSISGYFDNINHKILLKKLRRIGIHDKRVLSIIKEMLKAGYVEDGKLYKTDTGTVQGGIISPLLANVYLNDFDWFVGKMYLYPKRKCKHLENDRKRLKREGIKPKFLIRYADDWCLLTTTEQEANRLLKYLTKYFKHKLKLELSKEKTLITNLTEKPAEFLGFLIRAAPPRKTPQNKNPINIVGKPYPNMET